VLTAVLIFSAFILYPLSNTFTLSFEKWKGIAGTAKTFVGWENYAKALSSDRSGIRWETPCAFWRAVFLS
jgi:ABC-type sugar transport system permease subunit